eukprot:GHVL01023780.1.p1 GENE.GHVL01023780.1~~GHVL01023780.1.p1  ORF type:complete len:530 (+),score=57.06 GHVL01023780.1:86-1675(+)
MSNHFLQLGFMRLSSVSAAPVTFLIIFVIYVSMFNPVLSDESQIGRAVRFKRLPKSLNEVFYESKHEMTFEEQSKALVNLGLNKLAGERGTVFQHRQFLSKCFENFTLCTEDSRNIASCISCSQCTSSFPNSGRTDNVHSFLHDSKKLAARLAAGQPEINDLPDIKKPYSEATEYHPDESNIGISTNPMLSHDMERMANTCARRMSRTRCEMGLAGLRYLDFSTHPNLLWGPHGPKENIQLVLYKNGSKELVGHIPTLYQRTQTQLVIKWKGFSSLSHEAQSYDLGTVSVFLQIEPAGDPKHLDGWSLSKYNATPEGKKCEDNFTKCLHNLHSDSCKICFNDKVCTEDVRVGSYDVYKMLDFSKLKQRIVQGLNIHPTLTRAFFEIHKKNKLEALNKDEQCSSCKSGDCHAECQTARESLSVMILEEIASQDEDISFPKSESEKQEVENTDLDSCDMLHDKCVKWQTADADPKISYQNTCVACATDCHMKKQQLPKAKYEKACVSMILLHGDFNKLPPIYHSMVLFTFF